MSSRRSEGQSEHSDSLNGTKTATTRPQRPPTLREVASVAGVDVSTASRALRTETRGTVKSETLERVVATAEALGYRANPFARGLKDHRSMTVGMLIPDLANPLFPPIVRGIEDGLGEHGYVAILANTDMDPDRERHLLDLFLERRVDGLFLATALRSYPLIEKVVESRIPTVLVNRTMDDKRVSMVTTDDYHGMGLALRHLVNLGHKRIAFVGAAPSTSTGYNRHKYFLAWMDRLGLPLDEELLVTAPWFNKQSGAEACDELINRGREFTAIIAASDMIALGCYSSLRAHGLKIPDDVSVVGYNGSRWCDEFNPPLTAVHVPKYDLGRAAADLMLSLLQGPDTEPSRVFLDTSLQVRESTRQI
ncbi:LacI family transcriptional regulator [Georgenia yuyongxinii]|uniref:LacI family transcriptional regulator n=1 Tax=Georgenia yuyongxinii TaxID=2589797 RepID=A0A5B8C341_9MICO|nr:LacI family DNA-binding transcriptional regulator [Georgenia yuyongxinii]QDC24944.1 LacI family transcriptional regulator [Georgenia yuyongxinii]